ncbi:MAG: ribosome biogenesis GTPase Der, partial [Nitrospirota bacterium]|nr:ribosome biogenesis GTPase Der [Nitrospirota bacterium]
GLTPLDMEIVNLLRSITKPIFFAINKLDSPKSDALLADFYQLGQGNLYPISAEQGIGVDELLEAFLPLILPDTSNDELEELPKIALIGRPNVGKSTLLNTILGEDRVVVSDIPGTTRDPVDSQVTYQGKPYLFTDTAGIRRRGKIDRGIEGYSVARTLRALGRSDLGVFLLDGVEGVTEQDAKIAGLLIRQGKGCVLLINKWDLRKHEADAQHHYLEDLNRQFPFFSFVPTLFGSALQSDSLSYLFKKIDQVMKGFSTRVPTGQLNQFLQQALIANPLATRRGNSSRSVFMTQVATKPPTFALFVGKSVEVKPAYLRYLENQLRSTFGFEGTPLRVLVRKK